ncbi:hypothetical protein [Fictibacillus sp. JL2B1089]|uniref:hypothetical protein n=1 Tax=Fictibacillus sp. JL2B1089 TaxID=3399565 RepID=UPI003A88998B
MFEKLVSFTKKVADLVDEPTLDPILLKKQFDAAPDEVRVYLNKLIDALTKTTEGDSGAKNVGASSIAGLVGNDVQTLLESINNKMDNRLFIEVSRNTSPQNIPLNAMTKVLFNLTSTGNQTSQWSDNRFTAPKTGVYQIDISVGINQLDQFKAGELYLYKNGVQYRRLDKYVAPGSTSVHLSRALAIQLQSGDYIEFQVFCSQACELTEHTVAHITQLS